VRGRKAKTSNLSETFIQFVVAKLVQIFLKISLLLFPCGSLNRDGKKENSLRSLRLERSPAERDASSGGENQINPVFGRPLSVRYTSLASGVS
jgi:hypothetical protein